MHLQTKPILQNENIMLYPLDKDDFEKLYDVASDPKIWEQHPNKDRWQKQVFQTFFEGAISSQGAFKIIDKKTGDIIGSTRIYDHDANKQSVYIGYTFFATKYWGMGVNHAVKKMMLEYLFEFVSEVHFHIGAQNIRSQISIQRLGATKIGEQEVIYFGETPKLNFVYCISKEDWKVLSKM